jgi:hypothetical protein
MWFSYEDGVGTISMAGQIAIHPFPFGASIGTFTAAADGTVWASDSGQRLLYHITDDGNKVGRVAIPAPNALLMANRNGSVEAYDSGNGRRWAVSAYRVVQGRTLTLHEQPGQHDRIVPQEAAAGPSGTVWLAATVASPDGEVQRVVVLDESGRCIVPNLAHELLSFAKVDLAAHSCRVGNVANVNHQGLPASILPVVRQSAPAGRVLAPGARISVTVTN